MNGGGPGKLFIDNIESLLSCGMANIFGIDFPLDFFIDTPSNAPFQTIKMIKCPVLFLQGTTDNPYRKADAKKRRQPSIFKSKVVAISVAVLMIIITIIGTTKILAVLREVFLKDVVAGSWYESSVDLLVNKGITHGYPDGTFKPSSEVRVDEFVKMLLTSTGYQFDKRVNEMALPNGGYIITPSHAVPYDKEKLEPLKNTALEYGRKILQNNPLQYDA